MSELIWLENRAVLEVKGPESEDFLQGILTNDVLQLEDQKAIYAGLLTPQGKLLFDFFVVKTGDVFYLDVDKSEAQNLVKRLMFYKLRADVNIQMRQEAAICASLAGDAPNDSNAIGYEDPRTKKMGQRLLFLGGNGPDCASDETQWLAHRIALGIPEAGHDFTYGGCFPHDIAMDQLKGIGFKKGCYVGQEVVSRMQHRGTARKRPMIIIGERDLPNISAETPVKIQAEGSMIGTLGSVSGPMGLAEIRLDRAAKALANGKKFDVDGLPVLLQKPTWSDYGDEYDQVGEQVR
ncbi:MAG: folate-binding protein [Hyphomicrobiaceae bacterium]|nr:folate-binding protein [Hyphomicrobiaceae bacterium]